MESTPPSEPPSELTFGELDDDLGAKLKASLLAAFKEVTSPGLGHQEIVTTLKAFAGDDYGDHFRFTPGDIVILKDGAWLHGQGSPCLVLEIAEEPMFHRPPVDNAMAYKDWGAKLDMRVLHYGGAEDIHPHWTESWLYKLWTPDEAPQPEEAA